MLYKRVERQLYWNTRVEHHHLGDIHEHDMVTHAHTHTRRAKYETDGHGGRDSVRYGIASQGGIQVGEATNGIYRMTTRTK